jgi:hypothetical protein
MVRKGQRGAGVWVRMRKEKETLGLIHYIYES